MASAINTTQPRGLLLQKPSLLPLSHLDASKSPSLYFQRRKKIWHSAARASSATSTAVNDSVNGSARMSVRKQKLGQMGFTSSAEATLRFTLLEELMKCARNGDVKGAREIMDDMYIAGLTRGPHSFHGLIVAQAASGDEDGAMQSLRKEFSLGHRPLEETFVAMVRLFASKGHEVRGEEILAAMEKFKFDVRRAWLVLVEELFKAGYLQKANEVFLKGVEGGLRATDRLNDLLIEENCKAGDHSNAYTIAQNMESHGRMATTFHFNCLLSVQATCGIPEIAASTFENMLYGEDFMKPDTETYNWVIQAHTRASSGDRCQDVIELVGLMVEDYKHVQPNVKTYALLVECFTKYCVVNEALRHFRALKCYPGAMKVLYNGGKHGDPLSLYLRAICREGRAEELLDALETMARDNQSITSRAMIVNRKGRTLVSSWIEPLQQEAELGFEVDYVARYIAEGGLTGERRRWVPRGHRPLDPDCEGFFYSYPIETSYKQRCLENWKLYNKKLLSKLSTEGLYALGHITRRDLARMKDKLKGYTRRQLLRMKISDRLDLLGITKNGIERLKERLRRNIFGDTDIVERKPKAASKMLVSELKEELEGQDLPMDGNRQVLYQRVQEMRRLNRSRGRPLWLPPLQEEEKEVDDEVEMLISRLQLSYANDNTEYRKKRFLYITGTNMDDGKRGQVVATGPALVEVNHKDDSTDSKVTAKDEYEGKKNKDEDEDDEATEDEDDKEALVDAEEEATKPPEMLSDGEKQVPQKQATQKKSEETEEDPDDKWSDKWLDDKWFGESSVREKFQFIKAQHRLDVSDMYTIEDAWNWTWEKKRRARVPESWTQEKEVEIALKIMEKVIELGGTPTIGDCAMVLRAAIRAPLPRALVSILQTTHRLGHVFGSPLYDEVITLCMDLGERDAAIAIVTDLEAAGVTVPNETLDKVLHE